MSIDFGVRKNGVTRFYRVTRNRVNIPGFGIMTAEELVRNQDAIKFLIEEKHPFKILTEIENPDPESKPEPKAEEVMSLQEAKAAFTAKTGKSAGNRSLATLLKAIS